MKILVCSHTGVFRGGAERSLLLLAHSLSIKKLEYIINIPDKSEELINKLEYHNLKYVTINKDSNKESINSVSYLELLKKILKRAVYIIKMYWFIRKNNIDIVYLNTIRTTSEFIAAKLAGKKTVMHLRGFDSKMNFRFMALRGIDRFIVLNNSAKKIILNKIPSLEEQVVLTIPNGVQVNPFVKRKFINKILKIVFIGGYEYRKGADYFFEIAHCLLQQNENIQIIHIGEPLPKDNFTKELFERYSTLFENENYIELGFKHNVPALIKEFDIFILTSRIEGMPRSLLEAMERGLIPIVIDIDELKDIIRENDNGFFIKKNAIKDAIIKINKIIDHILEIDYISENARKDIENNYNIDKINQNIINALTRWDS